MSTVDALGSTTATSSGVDSKSLSNEDFMKIMIAELTNQDPFEPMNNQELVNQMATLQQMQSDMQMAKSFENLMEKYDDALFSQSLTAATSLIGEVVSGVNSSGKGDHRSCAGCDHERWSGDPGTG